MDYGFAEVSKLEKSYYYITILTFFSFIWVYLFEFSLGFDYPTLLKFLICVSTFYHILSCCNLEIQLHLDFQFHMSMKFKCNYYTQT